VEAFDLAAGLGVVGARVLEGDPEVGELGFEGADAVAVGGGEHGAVVGEHRGWIAPLTCGVMKHGDDISGGDDGQGC